MKSGFKSVAEKEFFRLVVGGLRKVYIGRDSLVDYHKELNKSLSEIPLYLDVGGFLSFSDIGVWLLEDHRREAVVVCPRECWCWELEKKINQDEERGGWF